VKPSTPRSLSVGRSARTRSGHTRSTRTLAPIAWPPSNTAIAGEYRVLYDEQPPGDAFLPDDLPPPDPCDRPWSPKREHPRALTPRLAVRPRLLAFSGFPNPFRLFLPPTTVTSRLRGRRSAATPRFPRPPDRPSIASRKPAQRAFVAASSQRNALLARSQGRRRVTFLPPFNTFVPAPRIANDAKGGDIRIDFNVRPIQPKRESKPESKPRGD